MSKRKARRSGEARRAVPRSAGGRAGQAGAAAAAHRLRPHQQPRVRHSRAARRRSARGRRHRGRAAADRRRSGLGQDPHADLSHRPSGRRARRRGGELPRHHLHPPRRRRDAGAPCAPAARPARARSPFTPSIRSVSPSCASMRAQPGSIAAFASRAKPSASHSSLRRWSSARTRPNACCAAISREKRTQSWAGAEVTEARAAYARAMALRNWIDFDDLVALVGPRPGRRMRALPSSTASRLRWISVDEFQDVDEQQYRLLTLLAPPDGNLCVIGDPNQAIYGFRGADASCFDRFRQDYPDGPDRAACAQLPLDRHHRHGVLAGHCAAAERADRRDRARHARAHRHPCRADGSAPKPRSVVKTIEHMIGGHSFFSIDSGRAAVGRAGRAGRSPTSPCSTAPTASRRRCARRSTRSGIPYQRQLPCGPRRGAGRARAVAGARRRQRRGDAGG